MLVKNFDTQSTTS